MRYTFFEFTNFKGVRHARLDLTDPLPGARVYTLVGLNESGKTTILEAIDHFQPSDEADEISPKQLAGWLIPDPDTLIPISERTNFNGEIVITCGIELTDADVTAARAHLRKTSDWYRLDDLDREIVISDRYQYENSHFTKRVSEWTGLTGRGRTKQGKVTRVIDYRSDRRRWQLLAKFLRSQLPVVRYFPNFLFDFPDKIYIEPDRLESQSNRFYRSVLQDILDTLGRDLTIDEHVTTRYRSDRRGDRENLQQVLLGVGRHVTQSVSAAWNAIFGDNALSQKRVVVDVGEDMVAPMSQADGPGADSEADHQGEPESAQAPEAREGDTGAARPPERRGPGLWVRFRIEDSDGLFSVGQRSLGFRWFFVYLMLTTYRGRAKEQTRDTLFLFDEPASNLHPRAQRALLASFRDLASKATIIYTTHSHHMIEPTWLPASFVIANAGLDAEAMSADFTANRTDISITPYRRFAAEHPEQSHYFQPILDVLDYAPSRLELVPAVVMVEGKSDFYLLAYYETIAVSGRGRDMLHIMPGGGAGTLDDVIQLYIGWARPFVALLDSDRTGEAQAERYLAKFGRALGPHLMLLREASGRGEAKGIESLLADEDRLAFQRLVEPNATSYRKKAFALGVQEALVARTVVSLSPAATTALEAVRRSIAERLASLSSGAESEGRAP